MKLSFFGAAHAVTGSCHCISVCGKQILIDCGLQQGRDEQDNRYLPFVPSMIDAVIVTHAHIDHSGRIPLLIKQGYTGPIYASSKTGELLDIMLRDSAHIQESDAEWENKKAKRSHKEPVEPLYTLADAMTAVRNLALVEYGQTVEIAPGITFRLTDAGHLLGSAYVELWLEENGVKKKLVFSGDIGNVDQPIIRDPQPIQEADYVIMESTYGDRNHSAPDDYTEALAQILNETFAKGGNVIIPSFAVGRTQELLYFLREIKERNLVPALPHFPVVVDSPLAAEATRIFSGNLTGYMDEEAIAVVQKGKGLFYVDDLKLSRTSEESKMLNEDRAPKVIISASGMCDAGRIRHHLKHNLWRPECAIVFVGFQSPGTLGRSLLEGKKFVKLFGEEVLVKAKIVNFQGLSSHADHDHLVEWVGQFQNPKPTEVFVVHGDDPVCESFAAELRQLGYQAHAPLFQEVYDLAEGKILSQGIVLEKKKASKWQDGSPAYRQLEEMGRQLELVIQKNKGGANKDLAKFASQIQALIDKWK